MALVDQVNSLATRVGTEFKSIRTALTGKVGTDGTVLNTVKLTQAQYDALGTKVATTLYIIQG